MNSYRSIVVLLISITVGLGAVALLSRWMQRQLAGSTLEVVVAVQDMPTGTLLQEGMLTTMPWPSATPLKDPVRSVQAGVGRVLSMPLFKDEPVVQGKLAPPGEKGGLSAQIPNGRRAVTVKVNEVVGVAGFALPGNFVDVMVSTTDQSNHPLSKIVLERIQVLAVAQDIHTPEGKPKVVNAVTLEVSPEQAEAIDLARSIGTLSLVLRNQRDTAGVTTPGARKDDLLRTSWPVPVRSAQTPVRAPTASPAPVMGTHAAIIRGLTLSAE
jgi:pilus assembly protein CpaB